MRLLHTMLRVGDLQRSIDFYTKVLGMKLLRTSENPEYKYSLAFVGYGSNPEQAEIELTYNWGIDSYELGTAYGHIALGVPDAVRGLRKDQAARRQRHARGRPGQGRHHGDRLRDRSRRLQDRVDPARRAAPRAAACAEALRVAPWQARRKRRSDTPRRAAARRERQRRHDQAAPT